MPEDRSVSRFGHVELDDLPADLQDRITPIAEKSGFLPNVSASLTDNDLDDVRGAGLTNEEIWDIGAITALFALSNRMAHLLALQPNAEFFTMGRQTG